MFIKEFLRRLVEKWTGHKCSRCRYNCAGHCTHPSDGMYMKCWHSITRPGYTGRYERPVRKCPGQPLTLAEGLSLDEGMTEEELHQLAKIKAALQEAGDVARESGLVED